MAAPDIERRILIIDSDPSVHAEFHDVLSHARNFRVTRAASEPTILADTVPASSMREFQIDSADQGKHALELVESARWAERPFALAFVDVGLPPGWDGVETTRSLLAADDELQVVACTADRHCSREEILREFGASGRVTLLKKPLDIAETCLLATSLTDKWRLIHDSNQWQRRQCEQISNTRRVMSIIEACLDELEHAHDELRGHASLLTQRLEQRQLEITGTRDLTMFALAQLADSRDPETGEHLLRMRAYAQLLAERLSANSPYSQEIDRPFLADFYRSTPLHDIGKVGIPDQILLKPGALTHDEFEVMKQHTIIGAKALVSAANQSCFGGFLKMAAVIARSHHEKFNGAGYPDGLVAHEIPLCARITAVADVFDALTSARVYKDAMPCSEARELIVSQAGQHFDPVIVDAFVACYDDFLRVKATVDEGRIDSNVPVACPVQPLPFIESERLLQADSLLENLSLLSTL